MNKRITSYDELIQEQQRLELLLEAQKTVIYYDVQHIKEELQPLRKTLSFLKKITTRDTTSWLLNIGSDIAINSLVKKFILSKAGWITKLVVPFFLKNYTSHFVSEQKEKWVEKLKSWLGQKNGKTYQEDDSYKEER